MDKRPDLLEKFEELLKQHTSKKPIRLYNSSKDEFKPEIQSKIAYNPKDVIRNISAQIKAIQNADCVINKTVNKLLEKHKTSILIPVNKLQKPVAPRIKTAKFETQFELDTQLMNVIEDVEAMSSHKGITQEFDSTFDHTNIELMNNRLEPPPDDKVEICTKDIRDHSSVNDIKSHNKDDNITKDNKPNLKNSDKTGVKLTISISQEKETQNNDADRLSNKAALDDHCTAFLDKCMEIEENIDVQDLITDTEINPSPIINLNNVNKSNSTSPLVYNLDFFEKFEKIAGPIIEENNDIDTVKHLINSQIIGKELFLQTDLEPELSKREESLSPVLRITKTSKIHTHKEDLAKPSASNAILNDDRSTTQEKIPIPFTYDEINLLGNTLDNFTESVLKNAKTQEKKSISFEDEILFSSDEENDIKETKIEDLPFTCALETSFYEHSDVLDTTMYVGFQTASNKSIQVSTVSFTKAKSVLDEEAEKTFKVPTLKELVEKCDTPKAKFTFISGNKRHDNDINEDSQKEQEHIDVRSKTAIINDANCIGFKTANGKAIEVSEKNMDKAKSLFNDIDSDTYKGPLQGIKIFDGFKTASNKNITLSEKALQRCKRVFQDIDLDDHLCDENFLFENEPCAKKIRHSLEYDKNKNSDIIKFSEEETCHSDIPKIDEDILQEFEGEMTLNENKNNVYNEFIGFKTATNKNIAISDSGFETSKNFFDGIDHIETSGSKIASDSNSMFNLDTEYIGFKTASNKRINISEKALARTKNIFQDIDLLNAETSSAYASVTGDIIKDVVKNDRTERKDKLDFEGFKTASNKMIKISEDALAKTKNIFRDIEDESDVNYNTEDKIDDELIKIAENIDFNRPSTSKDNFVGLRTANNKKITTSAAAFKKTKNVFQDLDYLAKNNNNLTEDLDVVKLIQDKKLTKEFENDFKTSDMDTEASDNKPVINKEETILDSNKFIGFRSNNNVIVSKVDISKSKALSQDILNEPEAVQSFKGFQTASNKKIQISDAALATSRKIFEDLDKVKDKTTIRTVQTANNRPLNISTEVLNNKIFEDVGKNNDLGKSRLSPVLKGFQTASNNDISISAAALAKRKKIFEGLDIDNKEKSKMENNDKTPGFRGFPTASNKEVIISDQALAKSTKVFEDLDIGNELEILDYNNKAQVFKGFQTASNKNVTVSDQALAKSRKIFEDMDKANINEVEKNSKTLIFKGFQTASNKKVVVSEQALAKGREGFKDITQSNIESQIVEINNENIAFKGIQTASNKHIEISAAALARSRKIFDDLDTVKEDNDQISRIKKDKSDLPKNYKDTSSFIGFHTSSNKRVSAAALEKSKNIFKDIDNVKEKDMPIGKNTTKVFSGFQTANNKEVKVSAEALSKSKKIFEGLEKDNEKVSSNKPLFPGNDRSDDFPLPFRGFSTASNKEIKISTDALAISKKIFQDLNEKENEINDPDYNKELCFVGFQTSSNKKAIISEEALAKSRQILSDIKINENQKSKVDFGFKTANNNNVKISEEALLKSKQLLTEIDDSEDILPNSCVIKLKNDKHSTKPDNNIDKLIDTQVIKNFDESLNTEDFRSPINRSKRSGSPILSCPRAKKPKFATPYKKGNVQDEKTPLTKQIEIYDNSYKKHKKYTLKDLAKLEKNSNAETDTDFDVNKINFHKFEFVDKRNDITNSKMSLQDLKEIFLKSVNKKLIPDGWYENHIKLILWKLLSYEIKFPKTMKGICTANNVLLQMKYRYFKELYSAERPALRKILERDDVASKMLALCVMEVYNDGSDNSVTNPPELLLTDGWYTIRTCIDKMLAKYVHDGKIAVGTKLVTHGAELVNCEQGVAPWEDTSSVRLKIFGNSTRRARWDTRLGYIGRSGMAVHLSALKPEGGKVSIVRVLVTRVYPPLYVEKFEDGSTVTRSERLEHIHQMKYESDRQAMVEKIYEEVEKEMSDEESPDTDDIDVSRRSLDTGSQIARLLKMSKEPSQFKANLTESQRRLLEAYTSSKRDKVLQDIQDRVRSKLTVMTRNVVPLMKVRVAEMDNGKIDKALLTIWKPNDAVSELITEGAYIEMLNVVPTAIRYSELQLSAGRQTIFKQTKKMPEKLKPYIKTLTRTCYPIKELVSHPNMATDYNEIDTVSMVIQIDPSYQDFKNINQFQNVYLTDENKNIICVNFWGGIKKFGFENVLDTGQIVACVNLQKRAGNTRKNIPQYRATEFTYFTKTPKSVVARTMVDEMAKNIGKNKGLIQECLIVKNNLSKSHISNEISPYRFQNHDLSKNKIYTESPLARIQPKVDEFNLSGLDFESTFRQTEPQELSPKSLLRKRRLHEKISKLKMYGEPPPLSPINIINKSKNATKSFKSPLLNSSVASNCDTPVANMKILPENRGDIELNCSPVLGVSRTLKKNVNPVKLNFNNVAVEENDTVDHFAEEFDASPPLSLD